MRKNKEFDHIIRQKMEGFVPSFDPVSWDSLSQKMDENDIVEAENDAFDALSREKLRNYEAKYNAAHWEIMAAKLEREFYFVQELFRWKTMEVVLMVLLLITFVRFFPDVSENKSIESNSVETTLIAGLNENNVDNSNKGIRSIQKDSNFSEGNNNKVVKSKNQVIVQAAGEKQKIEIDDIDNVRDAYSASIIPQLEHTITLLRSPKAGIPNFSIVKNFTSLAVSSLKTLSFPEIAQIKNSKNLIRQRLKLQKKKAVLRIGMFGSPNIDKIVNPAFEIDGESIPSLTRYALGYSSGISFGFERGRWEYETGITYTSKRYTPVWIQFQGGDITRGISNEIYTFFEFNSLSIPFKLRYNYLVQDKWRLYAYAGVAWTVTIQSYYDLASADPNETRYSNNKANIRNYSLKEIERNLVKGYFDGGSLSKNSYLNLNAGFGAERYIRKRWSVFTQVNYIRNFSQYEGGFGPYKEKIQTFSIATGLKVRLAD